MISHFKIIPIKWGPEHCKGTHKLPTVGCQPKKETSSSSLCAIGSKKASFFPFQIEPFVSYFGAHLAFFSSLWPPLRLPVKFAFEIRDLASVTNDTYATRARAKMAS